jgi:hypothetical protein
VTEVAPDSPVRLAVAGLAGQLLDRAPIAARRRVRR